MTPRALELSQKRQMKREIKGVRDQVNSIIYIDFSKILVKIYIGFKNFPLQMFDLGKNVKLI